MKSPKVDNRCSILIIFCIAVSSVLPSPISNQIPRRSPNNPDKIFFESEMENLTEVSKKNGKPITITQREASFDLKLKGICDDSDSRISNGSRSLLAADLDQGNVTCYEVGTQGPCPSNMKFYTIPGKVDLGMCDCDQELQGIAYSKETKECHHLFSQEFCKEGYWLELIQGGLQCTRNPCIGNGTAPPAARVVWHNSKCVTLYASCNNTLEGSLGHLEFDRSNEIRCLPGDTNYSLTKPVPQLKCSDGTRWSAITDSCQKAIKFDFS